MIATLIGGTGLTGSFLIQELLAAPGITRVLSISRKPLLLVDKPQAKLTEVFIADLAELPSIASKIRGDFYFCCLGTTINTAGSKEAFEKVDRTAVIDFAKIAKSHDARSLTLVSSMGANASSRFFYSQIKGRTEHEVTALGLRSLIIFRPGLLVGPRREFRLAETIANRTLIPLSRILPAQIRKSLATEVGTLAKQMQAEGVAAPPGVRIIEAKEIG